MWIDGALPGGCFQAASCQGNYEILCRFVAVSTEHSFRESLSLTIASLYLVAFASSRDSLGRSPCLLPSVTDED